MPLQQQGAQCFYSSKAHSAFTAARRKVRSGRLNPWRAGVSVFEGLVAGARADALDVDGAVRDLLVALYELVEPDILYGLVSLCLVVA